MKDILPCFSTLSLLKNFHAEHYERDLDMILHFKAAQKLSCRTL